MLPGALEEIFHYLMTKKFGRHIPLPEQHLRDLLLLTRSRLLEEPSLLELSAPLNVVGDIHGQYHDLMRYFDYVGHPPSQYFLFLGDYVDRGLNSIETLLLLFAYKIKYPNHVHLLRGNHESAVLNQFYGFFDECKRRATIKLWRSFTDCYNCLPVAAVINNRIFCCHGGISPDLFDMADIKAIGRPTLVPDKGLLCDLLWADPSNVKLGWSENERGVSVCFGSDIVNGFLRRFDFDLICRAHQVVEDGYEFFAKRQLVTVFSAVNYCGQFDNCGAMMIVDENLIISFFVLKPVKKVRISKPKHIED